MRLLGGTTVPSVINAPGADHGILSDNRPVHDDGAHADQHTILNRTAMQHHMVTDGHLVADDERMSIVRDVQHAEILHIRPVADADMIHVAANDRVKPGAAVFAHDHISDNNGRLLDKTGVGNSRLDALKRPDHDLNLG